MWKVVGSWVWVILVCCASLAADENPDQRAQSIIRDARKFNEHEDSRRVAAMALEASIKAFEAERDKSPDDPLIALGLARLQYELERDEESAKTLEQAIKLQPKLAAAYTFKGLTLLQTGKPREAEAEFLKAIEVAPKDPQVKSEYARFLFSTKRPEEGTKQAREANEIDPGQSEAAILYGSILEQSGKSAEALQVAKRAVELNGNDIPLRETLGSVYQANDKFAEAYEQFAAVIKIDPEYIDAEIRLLQLASVLRKPEEAKRHYERIYELDKAGKSFGDSFRRERFQVGNNYVVAIEFYELKGKRPLKYQFHVFDKTGDKSLYRVSLGSYDYTTEFARESGTIKPTERMYHLDFYRGSEHRTYGMYAVTPPSYEQVRQMVVDVVEGKKPAISSSDNRKKELTVPMP